MEDCYFFVDPDPNIPEEDKVVGVLCLECHDKYMPNIGWFYRGSVEGYGPWDYPCAKCNKLVHKSKKKKR